MGIRPLKEENYKECVEIINEAFHDSKNDTEYMSYNRFQKELNKGITFYGIFEQQNLVGCIGLLGKSEESYKIVRLATKPQYRHKGYGSKLMTYAENQAILLGGSKMSVGFRNENTLLKQWYQELGYEVEKIKEYKHGKRSIAFAVKKLPDILDLKAMNKRVNCCQVCGFPEQICICQTDENPEMKHQFLLIMHPEEAMRITNTGRLIKNTFPQNTNIFYWHRTRENMKLMRLLKSEEYYKVLVFPPDKEEYAHRAIKMETIGELKDRKKIMFIILDGTWKEARKMFRKSSYLQDIKMLDLKIDFQTEYSLRRNKDIGHICTIEVATELLKIIDEEGNAEKLYDYFKKFLQKYDKGKHML